MRSHVCVWVSTVPLSGPNSPNSVGGLVGSIRVPKSVLTLVSTFDERQRAGGTS